MICLRSGPEDLQRFILYLREKRAWSETPHAKDRPLSDTSVNTYVRAIRSFWSWMLGQKLIDVNPLAAVAAPKLPKTMPEIISETELNTILQKVSKKILYKALVLMLLDSGVRLAELVGMKMDHLDITDHRVRVFGKGGKERFAYFSDPTAETMVEYISQRQKTDYRGRQLWVSAEGKALTAGRVQKILEGIGRSAHLDFRLSAHKFRHTYATLILKNGLNMEYLKVTMGHEDIETTSNAYIRVADQDIARAYQKASPVTNLLGQEPQKSGVKPFPEKQLISIEKRPGAEGNYEGKIRDLARQLSEIIDLPSFRDKSLWDELPVEFRTGTYYLAIGKVEISDEGRLKVIYNDGTDSFAAPHLVDRLNNHFKTSDVPRFSELVGNEGRIHHLAIEIGKYSELLLIFLKAILNEVRTGEAMINFHDEPLPGLSKWFIITIWKDALEKACGRSWIDGSWYKLLESQTRAGLWELKCGGYTISLALDRDTLTIYQNWHSLLRVKFAKDQLAVKISAMHSELTTKVISIRQTIQEFIDSKYLPGTL